MNEREALLRAVCENPDEDTPRLVFADWLQENGEEARAEFIRLQVRHAELLRNAAPDADTFIRPTRDLWLRHRAKWSAELPQVTGLKWHDAFSRGFVERAVVTYDKILVENESAIFDQAPIRHLVITRFGGDVGFARLRGLSRLKTIYVINPRPTQKAVDALIQCERLSDAALVFFNFGEHGRPFQRSLEKRFGTRLSALTHGG